MTTTEVALHVAIERNPIEPGRKAVLVNGEEWGIIYMERHGPHGVSYRFEQSGEAGTIQFPPERPGSKYCRKAIVDGDKIARRRRGNEAEPASVAERLSAMAHDLIARKLLRHPAELAREHEESAARYRENSARQKADRHAGYLETAHRLIATAAPSLAVADEIEALAKAIAAALAKARDDE